MERNVIDLVQHINSKNEVKTFNEQELNPILLKNDNITQRRMYAFAVDFMSILVLNTSIQTAYALSLNEFLYNLNFKAKSALLMDSFPLQASVFILSYVTYFFYSMYILNGQTLGKKIFKLHTVKDSAIFEEEDLVEELSITQAFRRTFGYLACYLSFGTFFVFSLMSEDKRGLPDYLSSSRTVSEEWLISNMVFRHASAEIVKIDIASLEPAQETERAA